MDLAFGPGRKLRLAPETLVVDRELVEVQAGDLQNPYTTIIPAGRRTEGEPLNNAEAHSYLIRAIPDFDSEESSDEDSDELVTGTVDCELSNEPYFQQQRILEEIDIDDDIVIFNITEKTAGIVRFHNKTDHDIEVTCQKQYANWN